MAEICINCGIAMRKVTVRDYTTNRLKTIHICYTCGAEKG